MRKIVSLLIILAFLLMSSAAYMADATPEEQLKQVIKGYFDAKYKILSSLTYDKGFESCLAPYILKSGFAVSEADILDAIVLYRKSQVNDLKFSKYEYSLEYSSIKISGDTAWAFFTESCDLYFNCAPTVKNSTKTEHVMLLKRIGGKWLAANDDYSDPDGVKKKLTGIFLKKQVSIEEAKKLLLAESENRMDGRIDRLQKLMKGFENEQLFVFFKGKPVSYALGKAELIDAGGAAAPVEAGGTVLLPAGYICGKLGAAAVQDQKASRLKITYRNSIVEVKANDRFMLVNGKKVNLTSPAVIVKGNFMLTPEALAYIFNSKVYRDAGGLVILSEKGFDGKKNKELTGRLAVYFNTLFSKSDFPRIDGSTATYPLSIEMGKTLLGLDETGAKGFITHKTTHNAYVNLIEGKADIIFVTPPSPDEYKLAKEKGVELEVIPVCKEGFVFLVNKSNAVNNLTVKQVQDIYQGKVKNWKEVGGEDCEIIPYQREPNSGSQTLMESIVMKALKLAQPPKETLIYGMGELIDRVADYTNAKNALGYSVYYYATTMYRNRAIKLLAINGTTPDKQTIRKGSYPFTVAYYAVLRKNEPAGSNARKLLKWMLGDEGQEVVDRAGLVPVS